jgi:hypothetical protein
MTKRPRRNHSPVFKAKVAIAAIKGEIEGGPWPQMGPRKPPKA